MLPEKNNFMIESDVDYIEINYLYGQCKKVRLLLKFFAGEQVEMATISLLPLNFKNFFVAK